MWKIEKFTVTQKKFRQINSLVFSLVKTLLSRNFCQKSVTVNFRNFHTVYVLIISCNENDFAKIFSPDDKYKVFRISPL